MAEIKIQHGFTDELRLPIAQVFWEAFKGKMRFAMGNEEQAIVFLAESFIPENVFIALEGDEVLGVIGLRDADGRDCISITTASIQKHYGFFSGLLRLWVMGLVFSTQPNQGELWVDSIAVSSNARGKGIGTKLLDAAFEFANEHHYQVIGLEVIDTNPRAQALYERLGFEAVSEKSVGFFSKWVGFSSYIRMVKTAYKKDETQRI